MTRRKDQQDNVERPLVLILGNGAVAQGVRAAGGEPITVSAGDPEVPEVVASGAVDAVVLCGGTDVNASLYGEKPHTASWAYDNDRDLVEAYTVQMAQKHGVPLLGICRGSQMLNVALGGSLHQHLPDLRHVPQWEHSWNVHDVDVKHGRLQDAIGGKSRSAFLSIHHQGVKRVARALRVSAGHDGVVEAVEARSKSWWALGVQFHPESVKAGVDVKACFGIFRALVEAAAKQAGTPTPPPMRMPVPKKPKAQKAQKASKKTVKKNAANYRRQVGFQPAPKMKPARTNGKVVTSWYCFKGCGIPRFDHKADWVDHMMILHGCDVLEGVN